MTYKRTLALNPDGSYRIENGSLVWIDGAAAVEQELRTTLATIRGEDPFDEEHGLDVFEATGSPEAIVEREVSTALLDDDRVDAVTDIEITQLEGTRQTSVTVAVELVEGVGLEVESVI